jgi:peptidoglycan/LPS O-acetylase OafA/YrhL
MRSGTESDARIAGLDGVRGLAILAVMAFHFSAIAAVPSTTAVDTVWRTVPGGWTADLFFGLSVTDHQDPVPVRHSPVGTLHLHARRARLPRRFLLPILLILIRIIWSPDSRDFRDLEYSQLWFWTYLTNVWVAIRSGANTDLYGTGHLWSLAIEEQFYLIWPAVVLTLRRRQLLAVCAGAIVGALCFRVAMWAIGTPPPVVRAPPSRLMRRP